MTTATSEPDLQAGNYFTEARFFQTDVQTGVTRSRSGTRILALTDDFIVGFWQGFEEECGPAAGAVMQACGRHYGRRLGGRFVKELEGHYGGHMADWQLGVIEGCLSECLSIHGWGRITLDWSERKYGLILVRVPDAPFAAILGSSEKPNDYLLAGMLAGILGRLSHQDLDAVQTESTACGHSGNTFVIGLKSRLADADEWVGLGLNHDGVLRKLHMDVPDGAGSDN